MRTLNNFLDQFSAIMDLCFFEDSTQNRFDPLTLTRPPADLRVGILTLAEKWVRQMSADRVFHSTRPHLRDLYASDLSASNEPLLWINPRWLPDEVLVDRVEQLKKGEGLIDASKQMLIAAVVDGATSVSLIAEGKKPGKQKLDLETVENLRSVEYLWDLFLMNGEEIRRDINRIQPRRAPSDALAANVELSSPEQIYFGEDVTLEPGAIIIADEGPVYLGKGAKVMAGSIIRGPASIGADSVVKMGAKIYKDTTVGPVCKVGGEINNTIFHSYSNKGHDGFTGNSLFGQWCNLGADTNVSNLKNNYGEIDMRNWSTGEPVASGQQFIGTIMGDHSKTAINTMLNTGTMCGVSCNIFASGFPPKMIPSFSWIGDSGRRLYRLDKALETMEKMMARRDAELTDPYISMMEHLFEKAKS